MPSFKAVTPTTHFRVFSSALKQQCSFTSTTSQSTFLFAWIHSTRIFYRQSNKKTSSKTSKHRTHKQKQSSFQRKSIPKNLESLLKCVRYTQFVIFFARSVSLKLCLFHIFDGSGFGVHRIRYGSIIIIMIITIYETKWWSF